MYGKKEELQNIKNMQYCEIATRELASVHKPQGLEQNKKIAQMGGSAAKAARDNIEKNLGKSVISRDNRLNYKYIDDKSKIENK